jgi:TRAP-type C4-dicarboxylate transport system substrate-binding protein
MRDLKKPSIHNNFKKWRIKMKEKLFWRSRNACIYFSGFPKANNFWNTNSLTICFVRIRVVTAILMALYAGMVGADSQRLKFATIAPRGSVYHQALMTMGDTWRKSAPGDAVFTAFPDGSQGGEADFVRRMRIGQLSGAFMSATGLSEIEPSAAALQFMPLMFRSWDDIDAVRKRLKSLIEQRFLSKGYVVLYWGDAGWVRFFAKESAIHPDDFKRMKMFTWAGNTTQLDLMQTLGYKPVALETADILPGLQTGLIESVPVTAEWALAAQIDGPASHMLDIRWVPIAAATVITIKAWGSLDSAGQQALRNGAEQAAAQIREQREKLDSGSVEAMKQRGLTVHTLTPELEAEWRKWIAPVYSKIRGGMVPADVFDIVRDTLAEQHALRDLP